MAGEYRTEAVLQQLPAHLADKIRNGLRIGLTNQPMSGVLLCRDLTEPLAEAFDAIGQTKYADGLRNGSMVPLMPMHGPEKVWAPGELYMKS